MARVGLCMIVKDEAHVIVRCLASVRPYIDYWTIVDTGSTDGTQNAVRAALTGVPGQLLERPWVDFGHNRSEALAAARLHADYSWIIDADEEFVPTHGFAWPDLNADIVLLTHVDKTAFQRIALVSNRLPWAYRGVLHEVLEAPGAKTSLRIAEAKVVVRYDGGRSQGISVAEKYARDVVLLEAALRDEPDNTRYQYYLARSYAISERPELALVAYRRRARMGGFAEEVAHSLIEIARLLQQRGADPEDVVAAYLAAWEYRPTRAEPLAALAAYYRRNGRHALGRMIAMQAVAIPRPADLLWVDDEVYAWRCLAEYALCSLGAGHVEQAVRACRRLLADPGLPAERRPTISQLLATAAARLPKPTADLPSARTADSERAAV